MSKKAVNNQSSIVQLTLKAGEAKGGPPVATSLGPKGVNISEFCKLFNDKSVATMGPIVAALKAQFPDLKIEGPLEMKASVKVHENRKFDLEIRGTPTAYCLKQFAGINKGGTLPKREPFKGVVTRKQCEAIAKITLDYMNTDNLIGATKMVIGTAASMNIQVVEE